MDNLWIRTAILPLVNQNLSTVKMKQNNFNFIQYFIFCWNYLSIYSARCQHSEARNIICDNCQSSRNAYQRSNYNGMSNKDIISVLKRQNGIGTEIGLAEACSDSILVQAQKIKIFHSIIIYHVYLTNIISIK